MREMRQSISVYLRRVRAGEMFTVTDHGLPVALLIPLPALSGDPLADLVAAGRVLPAANRSGALPSPAAARADRPSVTEALLAERQAEQR